MALGIRLNYSGFEKLSCQYHKTKILLLGNAFAVVIDITPPIFSLIGIAAPA
jgi:hypothetical protein